MPDKHIKLQRIVSSGGVVDTFKVVQVVNDLSLKLGQVLYPLQVSQLGVQYDIEILPAIPLETQPKPIKGKLGPGRPA